MSNQVGKHAIYNIAGGLVPAIVGIFAVPILLHNLGADRLGVFTLALGLMGFAGILDLGVGRALTQATAVAKGKGHSVGAIAARARSASILVCAVGAASGLLLMVMADHLTAELFGLQASLAEEARLGVYWLGFAIPVMLLSASLIGVLEGLQLFGQINLVRVPVGILTFFAPALVSGFTENVGAVIASLVVVRLAALGVWVWQVCRVLPLWRGKPCNEADALTSAGFWRFSGWLTVSNVVGPLMVHADRFYLAALFPPAMVAHYTVPLDALFRATSLPLAAMNAAFPAFARVGSRAVESRQLLKRATVLMTVVWGGGALLGAWLLPELLELWVGWEFAAQSIEVATCLLFGVMVNGFAHIAYAVIQANGRADLTAKVHVVELPVFVLLLLLLVDAYGIFGAAVAWSARVVLDAMLLSGVSAFIFPRLRSELLLGMVAVCALMFTYGTLYFG